MRVRAHACVSSGYDAQVGSQRCIGTSWGWYLEGVSRAEGIEHFIAGREGENEKTIVAWLDVCKVLELGSVETRSNKETVYYYLRR